MISFVILLAVVACAHAQVQTVLYAGENAQKILDGDKPSEVFTIPGGVCEAFLPLEEIGCYYQYTNTYLDLAAIKVEVEDDAKVFIEVKEPIREVYIARHVGHCDNPGTVTITKQCMLGAIGPIPAINKRPAYRQKGHAVHF